MDTALDSRREAQGFGIALVLASSFVFALSDAVAKHVLATLPVIELFWIRCVVVSLVTLPVVVWRRGPAVLRSSRPGQQAMRGILTFAASMFFLSGLSYLELADATAINFLWPILITVFSVMFLGEKVGFRRMAATFAGFIGMLIIMRPGSGSFQAAAILPLAAAVCWAAASVLTRGLSRHEPPETTITWSALIQLAAATFALPFVWRAPSLEELAFCVLMGIGSAISHSMVVVAYGRAKASSLAPYGYAQLVWAAICGYAFFGTLPDRYIVLGAAIIVASGIYTIHRERVRQLVR